MRKAMRLVTALTVLATLVPLTTGCAIGRGEPLVVGDMVTETESFELGEVKSLDVDLSVNIGTLRVRGGAEELADVEFRYNVVEWKPDRFPARRSVDRVGAEVTFVESDLVSIICYNGSDVFLWPKLLWGNPHGRGAD